MEENNNVEEMNEQKDDEKAFTITRINWFPGHMNKALKMMEKEIKVVDCIIYVLDSRAPYSCINPKLNKAVGDKPIIYAFNKSDIADPERLKEWVEYFNKKGKTVILNSTQSGAGKKIEQKIREVAQVKIDKLKAKNINATLRAMVVGVPNSGKSTLINNLCGKARAVTGNKAGVTRGKQWVKIASGIELMDTPGTLWPAFDNNLVAHHLAYIGSIKEEVLDIPTLSLDFIRELQRLDKTILENRYKISIDDNETALAILEKICSARGYLLKKGELDYDKGAFALISDFKKGYLGNITLESVHDVKALNVKDRVVGKNAKR